MRPATPRFSTGGLSSPQASPRAGRQAGPGGGWGEEVLVEVGADQLDVAGLFLAEEVARAAQVEVAGADREAGAEPVEGRGGRKPLAGRGRDGLGRIGEEIGDAAHPAAPDAPAQLVQL